MPDGLVKPSGMKKYDSFGILHFVVHTFLESEIPLFFLTSATPCSAKEFYA
jgi:hypothetical protein